MSRLSTSLLSTAGLLLVTTLAIIPTRLHAQSKAPTVTIPAPAKGLPVVPAAGGADSFPKAEPRPTVASELLKPSTGASITTPGKPATTTTPGKPAITTTVAPTPGKPVTSTATPGTPGTPAKPGVAATSQPPIADLITVRLKLKERRVHVIQNGQSIANYPVAIGKKGWETPTGNWYVMEKITNPGWTSFKNGSVVAPGAKSPLGERWIGFWTDGKDMIGFHGTPDVKSVGKAVSSGCVRMYDKDVKELFQKVKIGTVVDVVNE